MTITKADLVSLNWRLLPRVRGNWILLALIAGGVVAYLVYAESPHTPQQYLVILLSGLLGGVVGVLAGFVISMLVILQSMGKNDGVLGAHVYALTDEGLHEHTDVNETLQKWAGVEQITKCRRYILFRVNGYLFHILPRRAFSDDVTYDAFSLLSKTPK